MKLRLNKIRLRPQEFSWPVVVSIYVAGIVLSLIAYHTVFRNWLEDYVVRRVEFNVREVIGKDPKLDSSIKIIAFDDKTVSMLKRFDLKVSEWATLLEEIAKYNPRSIFIDKLFSLPIGEDFNHFRDSDGEDFTRRVQNIKVPITVGSHILEEKIPGRKPLSFQHKDFDLYSRIVPQHVVGIAKRDIEALDWLQINEGDSYIYGPHHGIKDAFDHIGNIEYQNHAYVRPLVRIDDQLAVPHAGLLAAGEPKIVLGNIFMNRSMVPVDDSGRTLVNLSSKDEYYKHTLTMINFLRRINRGERLNIDPGDTVVILPLMYTGNVDFVETPVGKIQGGYIPIALINSSLTGQWIKIVKHGDAYSVMASVFAVSLAFVLFGLKFWLTLVFGAVAIALLGLGGFAYASHLLPWSFPLVSWLLSGSAVQALRSHIAEQRAQSLRNALQGSIPPEKLEEVVKHSSGFRIEPSERIVTIMFIDMVDFSLTSEKLDPRVAFDQLKEQLDMLTDCVHRHGGVIDKNLGDGLMCFFGYDYTTSTTTDDHADAALCCSIEIQRLSLMNTLQSYKSGQPLYPVRIGLNTASVYLGDIGDSRRIDFTLIGSGVNFASRLESACEPFKIMLGTETHECLQAFSKEDPGLHLRYVQIKHHDELFSAYEYNPFFTEQSYLQKAMNAYRQYARLDRRHHRVPVTVPGSLVMTSEVGESRIINASYKGFAIESPSYLARGVSFNASIRSTDPIVNKRLEDLGLMPFNVEIRWGSYNPHSESYLLGIRITSLNDHQARDMFNAFSSQLNIGAMREAG